MIIIYYKDAWMAVKHVFYKVNSQNETNFL